jgi:hypothetical protein
MRYIYIGFLVLGLIFSGCGGSNGVSKEEYEKSSQEKEKDKAKPTPTKKSYIGYVTDSPVWGLEYKCESGESKETDKNGKFICKKLPVTFSVGNVVIGSVVNLPEDKKVFPQDIVGVSRSKVDDNDVKRLASFLQSVDDDGEIGEVIKIDKDIKARLKGKKKVDLVKLDESEIESILDKKMVEFEEAIKHLQNNLVYDKKPSSIELSLSNEKLPLGLKAEASLLGIYEMGDGIVKSIITKGVSFKSYDNSIAKIDENGTITTKKEGTVEIEASYNGQKSTATLTVSGIALKEIKIEDLTLSQLTDLAIGRNIHVGVKGHYSSNNIVKDVSDQVIWNSKSPYFSKIDSDGYIKADGMGWATLSATLFDLQDTIEFEIKKSEIKKVKIYPKETKIPKGKSVEAILLGIYEDDSNTTINDMNRSLTMVATWSVDDNETLLYTEDGNITPNSYYVPSYSSSTIYDPSSHNEYKYEDDKYQTRYRGLIANKEGKATLFVKYKNFKDSIDIEVVKAVVDDIDLRVVKTNLKADESIQANVRAMYSDGKIDNNFTSKVVFESLNPAILSVNGDGNVTALKGGYATIKATFVTPDRNITDTQYISVDFKPVAIEISSSKDSMQLGSSQKLYINIVNENGDKNSLYGEDIEWSVDKSDIAKMDTTYGYANLSGLKEGEVKVTAKFGKLTTTKTIKVVGPKSIEIVSEKDEIALGSSLNLSINAVYENGDKNSLYGEDIEWSIDKSDIVRMYSYDSYTNLSGLKEGEVKVTAKFGKLTTTKTIKVVGPKSIEIVSEKDEIALGNSLNLRVNAVYESGDENSLNYDDIVWSIESGSENANLNVNYDANLRAVKQGDVTIKATYGNLSTTKTFKIVDPIFQSISIEPNYTTVYIGKTTQFKLIARYSDGSKKDLNDSISWKMLSNIATVDANGLVKGVMEGSSRLKATYQNQTASTEIRVEKIKVTSLSTEGERSYSLNLGDTTTLKVQAQYSDGSQKEITDNLIFSSDDESVAKADSKGVVKALKEGYTNIYVEYNGNDKSEYYMSGMNWFEIKVNNTISGASGSTN